VKTYEVCGFMKRFGFQTFSNIAVLCWYWLSAHSFHS